MATSELSREYHRIVIEARGALRRTIAAMVLDDAETARQLLAIALAGDFAGFIAASTARRDIVALVNQQLAGAGLELVETARN